jgi:hypothetical protein
VAAGKTLIPRGLRGIPLLSGHEISRALQCRVLTMQSFIKQADEALKAAPRTATAG